MSELNKVWLFDNVIIGNNHVMINVGLFEIARHLVKENSFPSVQFFGDQSHLKIIRDVSGESAHVNSLFTPIDVTHPASGLVNKALSWLKKLRTDRKVFQAIIKKARQEKPSVIFLNTINPLNFKYFVRAIKQCPEVKFLMVIHGELEYFYSDKTDSKTQLYKKQYQYLFDHLPSNLRLLALNQKVQSQLVMDQILHEDKIFFMRHPLSESSHSTTHQLTNEILQVISFGVANARKNSMGLNELARFLHKDKVQFKVLGRTEIVLDDAIVIASKDGKSIPQQEYESSIKDAHYSISLMQSPNYIYRVSGSLLDSVVYRKPLLALNHPAVDELFDLGGDIGYRFDNLEEMSQLIQTISKRPHDFTSQYEIQVANLERLNKLFTPEAIAQELKHYICSY